MPPPGEILTPNQRRILLVCMSTGCLSSGSQAVYTALQRAVSERGLDDVVAVKRSGCHGFCQQGPLVAVEPDGVLYTHVTGADAQEIVSRHLGDGVLVERLLYYDRVSGRRIVRRDEIPFYAGQTRTILRNCGKIDPENIEDYFDAGGYQALRLALSELTRDEIIEEVTRSGLRGRGGAGFPTGRKWAACRRAAGEPKYIICNGDEGDPGAFMDRSILEADPHSVLEGVIIGAYAVGASHGFVFVRSEYPMAVERLRQALKEAERWGFLGDNILESNFSFTLDVACGSGAFISGEATALIASLEGWTGEPRPRPPRTAETGLWGKPTVINNVKTWAAVPPIILQGANWFASTGTALSKGTMVFSLTGSISNTGLAEVPMGTSLRRLVYDIGGGVPDGKQAKAIQVGGPSGGCLPVSLLDTPVGYEEMIALGMTLGAGGLVVLDETICMVQMARYFLSFTMKESCGKCVPCREGIRRMHDILTDITGGKGRPGDLERLIEMGETIADSSLCGLGANGPNPVLTTIRYFSHEYRAHIEEKRCPALACRDMLRFHIDPQKCQACGLCVRVCPAKAISASSKCLPIIEEVKCNRCGSCLDVCPDEFQAVIKTSGGPSLSSANYPCSPSLIAKSSYEIPR